jgi:hypothetical protein
VFEEVLENDFLPQAIKLKENSKHQECKKDHSMMGSLSGDSVSSDSDMFAGLPLVGSVVNRNIVTQKPRVTKPDVPLKAKTATTRETQIAIEKRKFFAKSPISNKSKPLLFSHIKIRRSGRNSAQSFSSNKEKSTKGLRVKRIDTDGGS